MHGTAESLRATAAVFVALLVMFAAAALWRPGSGSEPVPEASSASFVFAAAGDYGFGSDWQPSLDKLAVSGSNFLLALGDLSYGSATEQTWCQTVKAVLNDVAIIAGNHDTGESSGGNINNYVQYCPYTLPGPVTGTYGKEYWFDYPWPGPLARFILISPGVTYNVDGTGRWDYNVGSPRYNFVRDAIDAARSGGIPWVVVGMHKNCVTTGAKSCEIGTDLFNLFLDRKVDLVLEGHDHNVQRSKQLYCASITVNGYDPNCVVDDGADDFYSRGQGLVLDIAGSFGKCCYPASWSDLEAGYFAKIASDTKGFYKYTVSADSIVAEFVNASGPFTDLFTIGGTPPPPPPFALSVNPGAASVNPGSEAATTVTVGGLSSGPVGLSVSGCPPASTCTLATPSGNPFFTSALTVATTSSTPLGTYPVTVTGTNATRSNQTVYALTVSTLVTRTFQKGDGGPYSEIDDTYLYSGSPNTNYGTDAKLYMDTSGCIAGGTVCKALVKFPDFLGPNPGQVPLGVAIQSASLEFTVSDPGGLQNVYQVTEPWQELTATWNSFGSPGSPARKPLAGTFTPNSGRMSIDITAIVQNWASGDANEGVLFDPTSSNGADLESSESANPEKLTVVFAPPGDASVQDLRASLGGPGLGDVVLSWIPPGSVAGVLHYAVYGGTSYDANGAGYAFLGTSSVGTDTFPHVGAGKGDPSTYFYRIETNTSSGSVPNLVQVAKFGKTLQAGPNLVALPFDPFDARASAVLAVLAGEFESVRAYDATDPADPWKSYRPGVGGDLLELRGGTGFWVNVPVGPVSFAVAGIVPQTTVLNLEAGWNLVGLSRAAPMPVATALSGLPYLGVEGPASVPPYDLAAMGPGDLLVPGAGYWIRMGAAAVWSVPFDPSL